MLLPNLLRCARLHLLAILLAQSLSALSVLPPTFPDLVAESDTIVQAETLDVSSRWTTNAGGHRVIKTYVTVRVDRTLKGAASPELTLEFLGGRVGEDALIIPGLPTFAVGERDFLFLAQNGASFCPLLAARHGRYPVRFTPSTGQALVLRANGMPLRSLAEVDQPLLPTAAARLAPVADAPPMNVATFAQLIQAEVARSGPARRQLP